MLEEVLNISKTLSGNVIVVGINNNQVLDKIYKNNKVNNLYTLNKARLLKKTSDKAIKIKANKLKRELNSDIDYMLCDLNGINLEFKKVLYNTYNLVTNEIIYYGVYDEYDFQLLIKKYERFNASCSLKKYDDGYILKIDMHKCEVKRLFLYKIKDALNDIVEAIGNLLVS